jgi:6-pyruvoyltetrahydropterin/6-carboxytetrahydropterin synthase
MECVITKTFRFEASHVLPKHPGKCSRLHGHSWVLHVSVAGQINPETGFVVDYGDLKELVEREIIARLDHTHLGSGHMRAGFTQTGIELQCPFGAAFYPSSENIVVAIGKMLVPLVQEIKHGNARLYEVSLEETCTSACRWRPTYAYS